RKSGSTARRTRSSTADPVLPGRSPVSSSPPAVVRHDGEVTTMTDPFFDTVDSISYEGPDSDNPLAFRWYDADRVVLGRSMREHLRFATCYWHSLKWNGLYIFGDGTLDRPWLSGSDPRAAAEQKMEAAFEFFE